MSNPASTEYLKIPLREFQYCYDKIMRLEKENKELKLLLDGANQICNKIAALVGDVGQYRDLVEAVEMKLYNDNNNRVL